MSVWYEANTFHRARVEVHSGAVYRANTLDGCPIVVTGILPADRMAATIQRILSLASAAAPARTVAAAAPPACR